MTSGQRAVDLNADLGESFGAWRLGDDEALLAIVTSANVACGFHAGDPLTIRRTCAGAVARGVTIGAQVSYRDLAGFGRREMTVPPDELTAEVLYQIAALDGVARAEGGRVSYVKPHGALYNRAVGIPSRRPPSPPPIASYDASLPLLTLPGSAAETAATEAGLAVVAEAFADRGYRADGTLVPRGQPGAVLSEPDRVAARIVEMVTNGSVESVTGNRVPLQPRSICVHGDTPGAVALATAVRMALEQAGLTLAAFA